MPFNEFLDVAYDNLQIAKDLEEVKQTNGQVSFDHALEVQRQLHQLDSEWQE